MHVFSVPIEFTFRLQFCHATVSPLRNSGVSRYLSIFEDDLRFNPFTTGNNFRAVGYRFPLGPIVINITFKEERKCPRFAVLTRRTNFTLALPFQGKLNIFLPRSQY